ncbi:MAG: beta-lactamase family protein, partial [Chloroflexi bacterium]|nr:beta-lactamase family protein [Chloroflexota bacterium]
TPAQVPGSPSGSGRFAGLDDVVRTAIAQTGIPGVAVGVLAGGEEYVAGFGVTNVEAPNAVDGDTLFQIGSISKTFTMAAIMRLVEQGQLDLDAPVRQYLPDLKFSDPMATSRVSLRQLLTHTSGLSADDFAAMDGGDRALAEYVAERVPVTTFVLPPGRYVSYSNTGFSLAGRVLEVASGQLYEAAIADLLLQPLGMNTATFFANQAILRMSAAGHVVLDGQAVMQRVWQLPRTANAAGGLVASVREMLRYARLWLNDGVSPDGVRLLSPAALDAIGTEQAKGPADLVSFGLGWGLGRISSVTAWAHDGSTLGQNARLWVVRDNDVAFCVLTNAVDGSPVLGAVTAWSLQNVLGIDFAPPPPPTPLALSQAALTEYAGAYENPGETRWTVSVHDGGLVLAMEGVDPVFLASQPAAPDPPPLEVVFSAPDEVYAVANPRFRATFLRDANQRIAGLFVLVRYNPRLA